MPRTTLAMLISALLFTGNLTAQEIELKLPSVTKPDVAEQAKDTESILNLASEASKAPAKQESLTDDKTPVTEDNDEKPSDDEVAQDLGPAVVSVNEQGELIGQANATINGNSVPIEANITLVSGGVLLGKTIANEDGSFSFSNVSPGDYNIYGCASSFCGSRACTVVTDNNRFERVQVQLDQTSACGCNIGYAEAPATSFSGGTGGGFGSGAGGGFGSGAGGGFGGGAGGGGGAVTGGGLIGRRGFRLLAVGGIATAIAVGASDDDEVSPSE